MEDTLDKRVADLEALIADLPELINIRFERVDAALSEHAARFNLLDKQMAMLVRDTRDLRGGVTRQLVEQVRRLGAIEQRLELHDKRLAAIESDVAEIKGLVEQVSRLGTIEQGLEEHNKRLAAIESDVAEIKAAVTEILRRLPKT